LYFGCSNPESTEEVTYTDTEYSFMTIVGSEFLASSDAAINTWYNGTHIPLLMQYPGLKKSVCYKNSAAGATPGVLRSANLVAYRRIIR
jgi:hypothetical protein